MGEANAQSIMRVLFVISALSLATFVCALPADIATDDEASFSDAEPMLLLQEAQKTVADMKSKGATQADCKELATTMCAELEAQVKTNQDVLAALPNGNQCLNLGQDAVTAAQNVLADKSTGLTAAEKAVTDASSAQVAFNSVTFSALKPIEGECGNFFSSGSNYLALKLVLDNAITAKAIAQGAKQEAEVALQNAQQNAEKLKKSCLCETKKKRDDEWDRLSAPALLQEQETGKAKCRMMTCVLDGTPTTDDSCKSDLTKLTKPALIDAAENLSTGHCTGVNGRAPITIVEGRSTSNDAAARATTSWEYTSGTADLKIFDGNTGTDISCQHPRCQHDEYTAVRLSGTCDSAKVQVYGRDGKIASTPLRHIRIAYSTDGNTWTCYTKSDEAWSDGKRRGAETGCNHGSAHGKNGQTWEIPGPAQYIRVGTWGDTHVREIKLKSCVGSSASGGPQGHV